MRTHHAFTFAAGGAALLAAAMTSQAPAQVIQVIYSKVSGNPTAIVPGAVDPAGNPAVTEWRALEDLIGSSADGQWLLKGRTQQGTASETILLLGQHDAGTMFAQKSRPVHGGLPGEVYDFFGSGVGRFNDNGDFAYSARAMGGSASTFQKVIKVIGGNATLVAQMGDLYTGLQDTPANPVGDETVGNSIGSIHLLNSGVIGAQDSTIQNIHSSWRPAIFYDLVSFHQSNVTTVTSLNGLNNETWKSISANSFYTTPDGARWLAIGTVVAPTTNDAVLVVDGVVKVQEGFTIPNTSITAGTPTPVITADVVPNGDWYARGNINGGGVWAMRNGAILAKTGDPVTPTENWASSFSSIGGNNNADWFLGGQTDGPAASNEVIVVNGEVIVREGDQVDLDGNGTLDDDAYIGRGTNTLSALDANDVFLTDDGWLYFIANLHNAAGVDLNTSAPGFGTPHAFMRIQVPGKPICLGDADGNGTVDFDDVLAMLFVWGPCKGCPEDVDGNGEVNFDDVLAALFNWGECP